VEYVDDDVILYPMESKRRSYLSSTYDSEAMSCDHPASAIIGLHISLGPTLKHSNQDLCPPYLASLASLASRRDTFHYQSESTVPG